MEKQTHKLLAAILSIIMILSVLPLLTFTAFAETEGIFTYSVSDGKATITGLVDKNTAGAIEIPSTIGGYPVTEIGNYAFYGCTGLTSITIPDSVTSIGDYAFDGCTGLTSITLPNSVTSIGAYAFYYCTGLTSITIPDSVTEIGSWVFWYCTGLESAVIRNSTIGYGEFRDCTNLKELIITDSVTTICDWALDNCISLEGISIPRSVTDISRCAFGGCTYERTDGGGLPGLKSIIVSKDNAVYHSSNNCLINTNSKKLILGCKNSIIPTDGSVTEISCYAFSCHKDITSITIPNSVTSIGFSAFSGCTELTSITIPDSVTEIDEWVFYNTAWYNNQPDGLIYAGKVAYEYKGECPANVTIKDGIYAINEVAFICAGLKSITIPDSVISIGSRAFESCFELTDVYYTGTEQQKASIIIDNLWNGNDYLLNATWHYNFNPDTDCTHTKTIWKVIKKATLKEKGLKQEICSRCGEILNSEEIPALGVTYSIDTAKENIEENISVAQSAGSNLPETVEVKAEKTNADDKQVTYEIRLEDNGEVIQPEAPVLVKLPIPAGFNRDKLNIYRTEPDGRKTRLDFIIDGDYAYFETDHFSIYEIIEKLCGDISGDGSLNNGDLVTLFQYLSGWGNEVNKIAVDINGDGKENNQDLVLLFQYLSGWDVEIF